MNIKRDVIVIGAGPAGSICASYMAKNGLDVLLLDKSIFPRDKVCGDLQSEAIVKHVNALGALEEMDRMATCVRGVMLVGNNGNSCVLPYECYVTPRYKLDYLLIKTAAKHGVEVRQGCRVLDVITENRYATGVKVRESGVETEIKCKLIIVADGAYSTAAKSLGIMREKPEATWLGQRAYFKNVKLNSALARDQYNAYGIFSFDESIKPGYFWIVPSGEKGVEEGYCNVGVMAYNRDAARERSLEDMFIEWSRSNPVAKEALQDAEQVTDWEGGKLADIGQGIRKAGNGYMVIGDAAAFMLPLKNDGMTSGAYSAKLAADAAAEAIREGDVSDELLGRLYAEKLESYIDEDRLKRTGLTLESLNDERVIEDFIESMKTNKGYAEKFFKNAEANGIDPGIA